MGVTPDEELKALLAMSKYFKLEHLQGSSLERRARFMR